MLRRSAANRSVLAQEVRNLRPVAAWVDLGIGVARKVRMGWSVLAPLLSQWQTRKQEPSGVVHKLAEAISIARSIAALWKNWR